MILSDEEIKERMESPINLMNRLHQLSNRVPSSIPSLPSPKSSDLIPNIDEKLNNTRVKALGILNSAMDELRSRIPLVQKPEKLAQIATEMSRVIANQDAKNQGSGITAGQIVIYAPSVRKLEDYDVVEVQENS